MDWKGRAPYRGFLIWVGQAHGGTWISSVAALPEGRAGFPAGPGEQCAPGDFGSEEAAVEAAKRHIDDIQARRGGTGKRLKTEGHGKLRSSRRRK